MLDFHADFVFRVESHFVYAYNAGILVCLYNGRTGKCEIDSSYLKSIDINNLVPYMISLYNDTPAPGASTPVK